MVNTDKLVGAIVSAGYTVKTGAKAIGMPESTMYRKLERGVFDSDEIYEMIRTFHIEDIAGIFFAEKKGRRK